MTKGKDGVAVREEPCMTVAVVIEIISLRFLLGVFPRFSLNVFLSVAAAGFRYFYATTNSSAFFLTRSFSGRMPIAGCA